MILVKFISVLFCGSIFPFKNYTSTRRWSLTGSLHDNGKVQLGPFLWLYISFKTIPVQNLIPVRDISVAVHPGPVAVLDRGPPTGTKTYTFYTM